MGGPVGSGKTALGEALGKRLRDVYDIYAITNDIYTKEDQLILTRAGALPAERIVGVETGGCPHTAIREDASMNLAAIDEMNHHATVHLHQSEERRGRGGHRAVHRRERWFGPGTRRGRPSNHHHRGRGRTPSLTRNTSI
jgi:hypothetical protein